MTWIEIIQLKPFTGADQDQAEKAFRQLSSPVWNEDLREINLFRSPTLDHELSIVIGWNGDIPFGGKSRLGVQLATAFSEFGHIYHAGWQHSSKLIIQPHLTFRMEA